MVWSRKHDNMFSRFDTVPACDGQTGKQTSSLYLLCASAYIADARKNWLDPIPTWLLKQLKDTLAPVISSLYNCSFQTDVLPAAQKQAIVLPRLKKPTLDSSKLSSLRLRRLISNLSFISKLVERVAANRFIRHTEGNALFPVHQSSYLQNHSTETAVLCVHNSIVCAVDQKRMVALVLLNLSATFDAVDQATLLTMLQRRFGVCDTALAWLQSYLSDRTQNFLVNGVMSLPININCSAGLLMRPEKDEAKAEARKCEAEAKNFM